MKLPRCLMATSLMAVAPVAAHAQFFTIQSDSDTSVLSCAPYAGEYAPQTAKGRKMWFAIANLQKKY